MTSLALPAFDLVALVVSTAIFLLAFGCVEALVAQARGERPYRPRLPARMQRGGLRALPGTAVPRAARARFAKRELELSGAA